MEVSLFWVSTHRPAFLSNIFHFQKFALNKDRFEVRSFEQFEIWVESSQRLEKSENDVHIWLNMKNYEDLTKNIYALLQIWFINKGQLISKAIYGLLC